MNHQRTVYAVLTVLVLAAPVAAEPRRGQGSASAGLPPYEIVTIIRSTGLDPLDRPVRHGANYVLHAIDGVDREVRVVVRARTGRIVSVTPVTAADRMLPPDVVAGPYEPVPPVGYIPPAPPDVYEADAPVLYEGRPPVLYGPPPGPQAAPPRTIGGAPPDRSVTGSVPEPKVIRAIEPGKHGLLPPPPERFPHRVAPQAGKPKSTKRVVASVPKHAPLPRPRPANRAGASSAPAAVPKAKPAAENLPN